jgi:hypothetical protein
VTPKERSLARQVKALKAQTATLTSERNAARAQLATAQSKITTLTSERDAARSSLTTCQLGTTQAVSTMTPLQLTTTVFPIAYQVFEGWKDGYDDGDFSAKNIPEGSSGGAAKIRPCPQADRRS